MIWCLMVKWSDGGFMYCGGVVWCGIVKFVLWCVDCGFDWCDLGIVCCLCVCVLDVGCVFWVGRWIDVIGVLWCCCYFEEGDVMWYCGLLDLNYLLC